MEERLFFNFLDKFVGKEIESSLKARFRYQSLYKIKSKSGYDLLEIIHDVKTEKLEVHYKNDIPEILCKFFGTEFFESQINFIEWFKLRHNFKTEKDKIEFIRCINLS